MFKKTDPSKTAFRNIVAMDPSLEKEYCSNAVINSRYTPLNFLPKNLYEQFRRPLNMYFLLVACLQFISVIAPVNPLSTLLPLLFAFSVTAIKEGYDDVKRHRLDDEYNSRVFDVIRGGVWKKLKSKEIIVGDVVKVMRNDEIPCDLVGICAPEPVIYIRTDNLDGEIDLKPRDRVSLMQGGQSLIGSNMSPRTSISPNSLEQNQSLANAPGPAEVMEALGGCKFLYPPPSATISSFDARIEVEMGSERNRIPMGGNHLLLQSSYLKNTPWVFGLAVYTGNETKCGMNKADAPLKWGKLDRQVSNFSKIIFACQMLQALCFGIVGFFRNKSNRMEKWYITGMIAEANEWDWIIFPLRFFLLTSVMIPISFKMVVDISKYFMALILEWDMEMFDHSRGMGMKVKNSSIVEDLARIQYVLSDKTGTITQNLMTLVGCSLNGSRYTGLNNPAGVNYPESEAGKVAWKEFFTALAVCNTVEIETTSDGGYSYAAPSPDEEALCGAAGELGVQLVKRSKNSLTITMKGTGGGASPGKEGPSRQFTVLEVFGFTSDRKRMSIVLQEHISGHMADEVLIITKGADDRMTLLLKDPLNSTDKGKAAAMHLKEFASVGLRTLIVGSKSISAVEYKAFKARYDEAHNLVEGRAAAEQKLEEEMEKGLNFLGISAIEDKLQENVEKTLRDLIEANVRLWMLTGDKVETARQISLSCGLMNKEDKCIVLDPDQENWETTLMTAATPKPLNRMPSALGNKLIVPSSFTDGPSGSGSNAGGGPGQTLEGSNTSPNSTEQLLHSGADTTETRDSQRRPRYGSLGSVGEPILGAGSGDSVLVVHGECVAKILESPALLKKFIDISFKCKSVVCARVTPSQKAKVTALVAGQNKMTLAIGDGGNDVAMIQEAHVGIGIMGKEGQQAARAADFAITQFQYLTTLMFVHGHWSYKRTCYVVQYSFYKSMLISFIQLVFNMTMTMVSGVSFWNSWSLTAWNGLYTLPQVLFYIVDRCCPREALVENPSLYRLCQSGYGQTPATFFGFILRGVLQATAALGLVALFFGYNFISPFDGSTEATSSSFTVAYSVFILLQLFTVIVESNTMTWINLVGIFVMPLLYVLFTWIYALFPFLEYYGVFQRTLNGYTFLYVMALTAILFIPHFMFLTARKAFFPNYAEKCRQIAVEEQRRMARSIIRHRLSGNGRAPNNGVGTFEALKLRLQYLATFVWEVDVRGQRQGGSVHAPTMDLDP